MRPIVDLLVKAELQVARVAVQTVISASLNVERRQIETVRRVLRSVQVVLHVHAHERISVLTGLRDQTLDHRVQLTGVQAERSEEVLPQSVAGRLAVVQDLGEHRIDQRVTESEGGRREFVDDARVRVRIVFGVALIEHVQIQEFHCVRSKDNWQPFSIRDHLQLGSDYFPVKTGAISVESRSKEIEEYQKRSQSRSSCN